MLSANEDKLLEIGRGCKEIVVIPKWPARSVFISTEAYARLGDVHSALKPQGIKLVLTRGYEKENRFVAYAHGCFRKIGRKIFCFLYPERANEADEIFSPNGHDATGDSIDVSIVYENRLLKLLPRGVFTSKKTTSVIREDNRHVLNLVYKALEAGGFSVHRNETESLQIHCELRP
jgi:hypothetical protein